MPFQPPPRRGGAYQPRVQPWVSDGHHSGVLKERRIGSDWAHVLHSRLCGVPSERRGMPLTVPRALPWSAMRCPVGTPQADPLLTITGTPAPTSWSFNRSCRVLSLTLQKPRAVGPSSLVSITSADYADCADGNLFAAAHSAQGSSLLATTVMTKVN